MTTFDLLIIYKAPYQKKTIIKVFDYGYDAKSGMFYFDKNNYRSLLPKENVTYLGREFDYEEKPNL